MADEPKLTRFVIHGLRNNKSVNVPIEENTIVLVGENGSGKTTLLRMLFYFLSGRWLNLSNIPFTEMIITIDETEYTIRSKDLEGAVPALDERLLNRLPASARRRAIELYEAGMFDEAENVLLDYSGRFGFEKSGSMQTTERTKALAALNEQVLSHLGAQILYLPTYRRIERELSSIFQGVDADDARRFGRLSKQPEDGPNYVELVEFGMRDVQQAITKAVERLKNFGNNILDSVSQPWHTIGHEHRTENPG